MVCLVLLTKKAIDMLDNVWSAVFVLSHTCAEWIFTLKRNVKCLGVRLQTDIGCGLESHCSHFDNVCSSYIINSLWIDLK